MSNDLLTVSVIIPTHNRSASLRRTLNALVLQSYPARLVEVLVVTDGCSDGTGGMLRSFSAPFRLAILEQAQSGAAAARNCGASRATGSLLLFIDDDIEPSSSLIEVHARVHQARPGCAVMGPYLPLLQGRRDFFSILLRNSWYDRFQGMDQRGYRYRYNDLLSGNLSISAELFASIGGFDPTIRGAGGEDYEFGARLIKAGVRFAFAADALAYHHQGETIDLDRVLQRKRQEGYADVLIGRRHPDLRPTLFLAHFLKPKGVWDQVVHTLVYHLPSIGEWAALILRQLLDPLELLRLRRLWRKLFGGLCHYWYLRGAAEELGSSTDLTHFYQAEAGNTDTNRREIDVELDKGLQAAEERLDR